MCCCCCCQVLSVAYITAGLQMAFFGALCWDRRGRASRTKAKGAGWESSMVLDVVLGHQVWRWGHHDIKTLLQSSMVAKPGTVTDNQTFFYFVYYAWH